MSQPNRPTGTNRPSALPRRASVGLLTALAIGLGACQSDEVALGPMEVPGQSLDGLTCVATDDALATLAAIRARADLGLAARQSGRIPTTLVQLDPGAAPIEAAADQLSVRLTDEGLCGLDAVDAALEQIGGVLVHVDPATHVGWVRAVGPSTPSLPSWMGQVATIDGVAKVRLDRIAWGTGEGNQAPTVVPWLAPSKETLINQHGSLSAGAPPVEPSACAASEPYDGASMWHLAAMKMGGAWQRQPSAAPIVVALLDTGLTTGPDGAALAPGLEDAEVLAGYDFVNLDADPADDNGHGTLLAGIMASAGEYRGVAPGAALLPVKVLDADRKGDEAALIDGIRYAVARGADVISMSLAFPTGFMPSPDLALAIEQAAAAGVVVVAASGNHGRGEVSYPAAFGEVIAVGAGRLGKPVKPVSLECAESRHSSFVASKIVRAEYSGFGAPVDVCAPGGSMSHDLDHDGRPDAIAAYGFAPEEPTAFEAFLMAGTSAASAEAAAVSALLLAAGAEPGDVRALLQANARAMTEEPFETGCGSGLVDAARSLERLAQGRIPQLPLRFVNPIVTLARDNEGRRRGLALVEVVDEANQPVAGVTVLGHFRGLAGHDVSAVTDDRGRVLMASLAAPESAALFELTIDKILEPAADGSLLVTVPHSFARFEAASFRWLSAFQADGAGVEPTPWTIAIDPDAIAAYVAEFGLAMVHGADPSPPILSPVATIPDDIGSWTVVPSLLTRTLGGDRAPTTIAIDRQAIVNDCNLSEDLLPVRSTGAGVEPTPWRVSQSLLSEPITVSEVIVRADSLFLDGQPATETSLGLLFGDQGRVLIDIEGSVCEPRSVVLSDRSLLSDAVWDGLPVDDGGYHVVVDDDGAPPPPEEGAVPLDATALGAGLVEVPFCTEGPLWSASAAVGGSTGSGVQPLP